MPKLKNHNRCNGKERKKRGSEDPPSVKKSKQACRCVCKYTLKHGTIKYEICNCK